MVRALIIIALVVSVTRVADATACEIEGTLIGFASAGDVDGIPFVTPVLEDATADGCGANADIVPVMPDPLGDVWIAGTPWLEVGRRNRLLLRPGATLGTHAVVRRLPEAADGSRVGVPVPTPPIVGGILKSGNGQPPCSRSSWQEGAMPIPLDGPREFPLAMLDGFGDTTTSSNALRAALTDAAAAWASPGCSGAEFDVDFVLDEVPPLDPDGRNTLAWLGDDSEIFANLGEENLAFTCYVCDDDGWFVEADVRFDGAGHTWSTACDGVAWDVQGAAIHELGHVLGMPHTESTESVMFPVTSARRLLSLRVPDASDAAALCRKYPCPGAADCSGPIFEVEGCPPAAGACAPCDESTDCGAATDRCVQSAETGASICARACSASFPCPPGYECVNVGAQELQCVPVEGICPDLGFVGCGCTADEDCGGPDDRCLSDGVCGASCGGGEACPEGAECRVWFDGDGYAEARQCVPRDGFEPRCPRSGGRRRGCATSDSGGRSPAPWWSAAMLALGVGLVRKRVSR